MTSRESLFAMLTDLLHNDILPVANDGAPVNGTTGAGICGKGTRLTDYTNGVLYFNTGTKAAPIWTKIYPELPGDVLLANGHILVGNAGGVSADVAMSGDVTITNAGVTAIGADKVAATALGVTAGQVTASRAIVLDANKSLDHLQATTDISIGGTGIPGGAGVATRGIKVTTALPDTTATDTITVTVPNAEHAAMLKIKVIGILGAGGAVGEGEASKSVEYQATLTRTAGKNVAIGISAALGGIAATVAGGDAVTSVVATLSAVTGAVGAANTFTVKIAVTRSGAGATNHIAIVEWELMNFKATGVTVA